MAQVHEILQKYRTAHYIIIVGDFNEDITSHKSSRRKNSLNQVISENELTASINGKTYVNPNGVDVSTLDYIFYRDDLRHKVKSTRRLDDVHSSVSDHYPVLCTVELEVNSTPNINLCMPQSSQIKWDKIDKDAYNAAVSEKLSSLRTNISSSGVLNLEVRKLNEILVGSAEELAPRKPRRHRKARLKVYSPEIKQAITDKKQAFWQ